MLDEEVARSATARDATVEPRGHAVATFLEDNPFLTRRVETLLAEDPILSDRARNVNVTTYGEYVTLSGSVPDYATIDAMKAKLDAMPGVARVYYDVQVNPMRDLDRRESDENIAFSLQRSLVDQPRVTIEVVRGVVTLRGEPTGDREVVERIVTRTPGVLTIMNELSEPLPEEILVQ